MEESHWKLLQRDRCNKFVVVVAFILIVFSHFIGGIDVGVVYERSVIAHDV